MALEFPDAVAALYQSSQELFVSERKRLAAELKASGDRAGAARLGKLGRPTLSAWAVNQLWRRARPSFEELLASSERLRRGDRGASSTHRDALTTLRTRAAALLSEGGHAATDATLRRVTTTLAALAAAGGFEPEPPGALSADRDPPGFEALEGALGLGAGSEAPARMWVEPATALATATVPKAVAEARAEPTTSAANDVTPRTAELGEEREQARREQQAHAEAERQAAARREREERARRQAEQEGKQRRAAERQELRVALHGVRAQLARDVAAVERLRAELALAEQGAERARSALAELEQRQARLDQSEAG